MVDGRRPRRRRSTADFSLQWGREREREREEINEPRELVRSSMGAQPFACLEALKLINCVARCLIAVVEY
jgi:hypothetical protein